MKKVISILCIVLLLCSTVAMAVSAAPAGTLEDPVVFTSTTLNTVKIPTNKTYYISFTDASGAAKRQISIVSSTDKTSGYDVVYGDVTESSDENGYCNLVCTPDENGTYLFTITNKSKKQATFYIDFIEVVPYVISETILYEGENAVTTTDAETTLFAFEPSDTGIYEVKVDKEAILSHWNGSAFFVTGLAEETTEGKLEVTCSAIGQSVLIGLNDIGEANITITRIGDYVGPVSVEYVAYVNKHTPVKGFEMPDAEFTAVDITVAQTVVLGDDGIYRYGSANGPVLYVDMTGTQGADLYECYYPSSGGETATRLHGTYVDADGNTCGYDYLAAMQAYADALDAEGYYYLTEDLANFLQMYGKDQGWFHPEYSPFETIKSGEFNEESAWLISACYDPTAGGVDPVIPEQPENPDDSETPSNPDAPIGGDNESQSPATGDVSSFGAIAALLLSSVGALSLSKKRN